MGTAPSPTTGGGRSAADGQHGRPRRRRGRRRRLAVAEQGTESWNRAATVCHPRGRPPRRRFLAADVLALLHT